MIHTEEHTEMCQSGSYSKAEFSMTLCGNMFGLLLVLYMRQTFNYMNRFMFIFNYSIPGTEKWNALRSGTQTRIFTRNSISEIFSPIGGSFYF